MVLEIVRRLLEHEAHTNICDSRHSTVLHQALFQGSFEIASLLLSYGAKVDEKDGIAERHLKWHRQKDIIK